MPLLQSCFPLLEKSPPIVCNPRCINFTTVFSWQNTSRDALSSISFINYIIYPLSELMCKRFNRYYQFAIIMPDTYQLLVLFNRTTSHKDSLDRVFHRTDALLTSDQLHRSTEGKLMCANETGKKGETGNDYSIFKHNIHVSCHCLSDHRQNKWTFHRWMCIPQVAVQCTWQQHRENALAHTYSPLY